MPYLYLKAIHIIFVVTWFAGLFYMPRLFIYNVEANEQPEPAKHILQKQFGIMMKRLWYGITWPSAVITLTMGLLVLWQSGYYAIIFKQQGIWLLLKLILVVLLYAYHFSLHKIFKQQSAGVFKYNSTQLRMWNEVATLFLIGIVILVVVKTAFSIVWGIAATVVLIILLMSAIKIYKNIRTKNAQKNPGA